MTTPKLVTIFGGSGFIGRYLVRHLAKAGAMIRVAVRDPEQALDLKPMGDVGQIVPIQANIRVPASVEAAIDGADGVVNLVGVLYERGAQTFDAVHRDGARTVARAAARAGSKSFVHMSALGASEQSGSAYARSKAAGEKSVREAFPGAAIIRPSVVFGPQDDFFNRFAKLACISPVLPLIGGGHTRFQPVYVDDVAEAMFKELCGAAAKEQTYELGGPIVYSFKELMELVLRMTGRKCMLVPLPFSVAAMQATVLQYLPVPPLTPDQVELLKTDNIVSGELPGLAELGIEATAAEVILPSYMDIYRRGGRYSDTQPS